MFFISILSRAHRSNEANLVRDGKDRQRIKIQESGKAEEKIMNEEEFDSSVGSAPFGTADAMRAEAQLRRCMSLGVALWGRTAHDLQRQLLAPHPEIPSGFDLAEFRRLQQQTQIISLAPWLPRSTLSSPIVFVGERRFTAWEARSEILRRAIEYLETR
jgi:hypothetical protein